MNSNTLRDIARVLDVTHDGLRTLQTFVHVGGPKTDIALQAVDAGLTTLVDVIAGKTHPDVAAADINSLVERVKSSQTSLETGLADNNAAVDAEIDKKFDKDPTQP
jgi:ABC-type uncharacterized transport system ATPase subunit